MPASLARRDDPPPMTPGQDFTELYERFASLVYRTALRITGRPEDAEDALQTVFARLLRQGARIDETQAPEGYFRRAAANAALDILRGRAHRAEAQLDESLPHAAVESSPYLKERLRRALATLEPQDAELFTLRYIEGVSNTEIAEMYGLERSTIGVRLHRIRRWLQEELER
jgi:RNA polymerase sigma-70 factor (ECF subfamily)